MELRLPDIGEGVAEGEILKWFVKEGDQIREEQPLVEVMTDKVNVQIPSPSSGKVSRIMAKEGDVVRVGQTIIVIDSGEGGAPAVTQSEPTRQEAGAPRPAGDVLATPATRKLAREMGVDLAKVKGSGPMGRVTEQDVRGAAQELAQPPASGEDRVQVRGVRKLVAEHMAKSVRTTAQVTHVDECDMTEVVALRESLKPEAERRGVKLTYLPFIVKAAVAALKEFPYANSSLDDQRGEILLRRSYNIGIAIDTESGLVVPVVRDADRKDVFEVAAEIQRMASKAREGQLSIEDVHGSTFTITNQGSVGGLFATPIINYPEAAILGSHKVAKRAVVRDGRIEARDVMFLSLSFDHRILDGAYAARFVNKVVAVLEDPKALRSEAGIA
ncbi:MAG: 2-oxo acid dehydrogenase subunit E2 [Nitrososphaerota archaeon]|nr:2-oxo acid dehydrogenase subunit E2 [Nitrososphaerota archaeon]MDG6966310.1 2-oxo acid dehydrogenase subunit E2 [Nitrososphaerota archaeon]MDG6977745.1 2-oxo acid dehydrogenase subunit E2 [Nitrososphaerota archaeon]MDG7005920.1 2-oxo acid dehydrogenase subunit E2 [Nitrososphaerota archaeon]MDG7021425.1 2-oxo acid dehydrogenase subunit E2 [Nitrososphaerota archaeon]